MGFQYLTGYKHGNKKFFTISSAEMEVSISTPSIPCWFVPQKAEGKKGFFLSKLDFSTPFHSDMLFSCPAEESVLFLCCFPVSAWQRDGRPSRAGGDESRRSSRGKKKKRQENPIEILHMLKNKPTHHHHQQKHTNKNPTNQKKKTNKKTLT